MEMLKRTGVPKENWNENRKDNKENNSNLAMQKYRNKRVGVRERIERMTWNVW